MRVEEEPQHVVAGFVAEGAGAAQRGGFDVPAVVRAAPGAESVAHLAGEVDAVGVAVFVDGGEEFLVRELGDGLGEHRASGAGPRVVLAGRVGAAGRGDGGGRGAGWRGFGAGAAVR